MATAKTKLANRPGSTDVETEILEAARDLLADGGVAGLSMRHIADRVGVTATAIYHYFDGKQQIVDTVVLHAFERFGACLKAAMEPHPKGSVERLHALGDAYIRFAVENDAYFRVIFSIQPKSHPGQQEIPEGGGYNLLREAVSDAMDVGTIVSLTPAGAGSGDVASVEPDQIDVVAMYLWSLAHGLVTLTLCGIGSGPECEHECNPQQLLRAFAPLINFGIRKPTDQTVGNEKN